MTKSPQQTTLALIFLFFLQSSMEKSCKVIHQNVSHFQRSSSSNSPWQNKPIQNTNTCRDYSTSFELIFLLPPLPTRCLLLIDFLLAVDFELQYREAAKTFDKALLLQVSLHFVQGFIKDSAVIDNPKLNRVKIYKTRCTRKSI